MGAWGKVGSGRAGLQTPVEALERLVVHTAFAGRGRSWVVLC